MKFILLILFSVGSAYCSEFLSTDEIATEIGRITLVEAYEGNGYDRNSGNSGRQWVVFLNTEKVGTLWAHRKAMRIEEFAGKVRLWTYIRGGGSTGRLGYYYISELGVSELESIRIHPGDNGTDVSNALASALFDDRISVKSSQ